MSTLMYNGSYYPLKATYTFTEIWASAAEFLDDYKEANLGGVSDQNATLLYYLLYARHGNDAIKDYNDTNRWCYQLFSVINIYGPNWEAELKLQEKVRDLLDNEAKLVKGSTELTNSGNNPGVKTNSTTAFTVGVDSQSGSYRTKDLMVAYAQLDALLKTQITETFLDRFDRLFNPCAQNNNPYIYSTTLEDEIEL